MSTSLEFRAWRGLAIVTIVMGILLFVPAGTLDYWQAWLYLWVTSSASVLTTLYLIKHDPALLERRLKGGPRAEKTPTQRVIMLFMSLGFVALLVVPALDVRFGWSEVPVAMVVLGDLLVATGFYGIFLVYRENSFASATVGVVENQKVISTGPYAIIRHPMYAWALLYLGGKPLALGSYWGLLVLAVLVPVLVWRLLDEERVLARELPGYPDYQNQVRCRLVPFVW